MEGGDRRLWNIIRMTRLHLLLVPVTLVLDRKGVTSGNESRSAAFVLVSMVMQVGAQGTSVQHQPRSLAYFTRPAVLRRLSLCMMFLRCVSMV